MARNSDDSSERGRQVRQISLALSIPMMLAAGPIAGWLLGWGAEKLFGAPAWFTLAGIFLGLIAGFRQAYLLIKRMDAD